MSYHPSPLDFQPRPRLPPSLKIVAWLFVISGILSAIDVVTAFCAGKLHLNFGVLCIFIGRGLLRLSPGWRTAALICLWFVFGIMLILLLATIGGCDMQVTWFGKRLHDTPETRMIGLLVLALWFALFFWEYRVLTRPDVRRLFYS
jgi:hypothetical protein